MSAGVISADTGTQAAARASNCRRVTPLADGAPPARNAVRSRDHKGAVFVEYESISRDALFRAQCFCANSQLAMPLTASALKFPGIRYSAGELLPSPARKRWFNAG